MDGLYLVQDDKNDVALGVGMMHAIYSGSYLTVAAATGHDATAGSCVLREPDEDKRLLLSGCSKPTTTSFKKRRGILRLLARTVAIYRTVPDPT